MLSGLGRWVCPWPCRCFLEPEDTGEASVTHEHTVDAVSVRRLDDGHWEVISVGPGPTGPMGGALFDVLRICPVLSRGRPAWVYAPRSKLHHQDTALRAAFDFHRQSVDIAEVNRAGGD